MTTGFIAGGYRLVQDEGTDLPAQTTMDFVGAGVTAADDPANGRTTVTITGGSGIPAAAPFTQVAKPNGIYGGDLQEMESDQFGDAVFAAGCPGDAHPRILITSDGGVYFGDGTFDPYNAGFSAFVIQHDDSGFGGLIIAATGTLQISSSTRIWINNAELQMGTSLVGKSIRFLHTASGPILKAADGTNHLILVDNAGVLSTTVVA